MLVALRWRQAHRWNLFVGDRSALFSLLRRAADPTQAERLEGHLERRLAHVLADLKAGWSALAPKPSWRISQEEDRAFWCKNLPPVGDQPGGRACWIAYEGPGLIGVDIKSHQVDSAFPCHSIVQGNAAVDDLCAHAATSQGRPDVRIPAGGAFAYVTCRGFRVTAPVSVHIRSLLREQAGRAAASRPVQGKLVRCAAAVYSPALDIKAYTAYEAPAALWHLTLDTDSAGGIDLAGPFYRMQRAIGGGWTERLHVDAELRELAEAWAHCRGYASARLCPFCLQGHGTPRHVIMTCREMAPLVDQVRDAVESALRRECNADALRDAGEEWASSRCPGWAAVPAAARSRWPILAAWRWLVSIPEREEFLAEAGTAESSAAATSREGAADLAYRGAMPRSLGRCLARGPAPTGLTADYADDAADDEADEDGASPPEEYATAHEPRRATVEASRRLTWAQRGTPAVRVTAVLVLGLWYVRSRYAARIDAWARLAQGAASGDLLGGDGDRSCRDAAADIPLARASAMVTRWAGTPAGAAVVQLLRWQAPTTRTLAARIRAEVPELRRFADRSLRRASAPLGVPVSEGGHVSWGPAMPGWSAARAALCVREFPAAQAGGDAGDASSCLTCLWCHGPTPNRCRACMLGFHFQGECMRWLAGASRVYATDDECPVLLCPDCAWQWASRSDAVAEIAGAAVAHAPVDAYMRGAAARALPGAGAAAAERRQARLLARRARRWLQVRLRRAAWVKERRLTQECTAALRTEADALPDQIASAVSHALRSLKQERRVWCDGAGTGLALRWASPGSPLLPRTEHTRTRRRRCRRAAPLSLQTLSLPAHFFGPRETCA